jgi:hypothetical protein
MLHKTTYEQCVVWYIQRTDSLCYNVLIIHRTCKSCFTYCSTLSRHKVGLYVQLNEFSEGLSYNNKPSDHKPYLDTKNENNLCDVEINHSTYGEQLRFVKKGQRHYVFGSVHKLRS